MNGLPSRGPLNLPIGGVSSRTSVRVGAVEPNALEQLADLRVEIVALRNLLEVGLDLLAGGVPAAEIARFLTSQGPYNAKTGCRCELHQRAA